MWNRWQCWTSFHSFCSEDTSRMWQICWYAWRVWPRLLLRWHVFMIARFAIGTLSLVLGTCCRLLLHADSCLNLLLMPVFMSYMPYLILLALLAWLHASTSMKMLWIGLLRIAFVVLDSFACLSHSETFCACCATKNCRMCSWRTFCSWNKTHLWRRQSKGKERAKHWSSI